MHEDRVRRRMAHQLAVDLVGREQVMAAALVLVAHRHPAIRDDRRRVPGRRDRIIAEADVRARGARGVEPLLARLQFARAGDLQPEAEAR